MDFYWAWEHADGFEWPIQLYEVIEIHLKESFFVKIPSFKVRISLQMALNGQ